MCVPSRLHLVVRGRRCLRTVAPRFYVIGLGPKPQASDGQTQAGVGPHCGMCISAGAIVRPLHPLTAERSALLGRTHPCTHCHEPRKNPPPCFVLAQCVEPQTLHSISPVLPFTNLMVLGVPITFPFRIDDEPALAMPRLDRFR
jgi:hypothetical protein